jgi:uncharacterized membrane protein YgdD (TMEM256/DUF423 family)
MDNSHGGEHRSVHFSTARRFLIVGCMSGVTAVILGAFGSHVIKPLLAENQFQLFETGVKYHFYHTFAIISAAFVSRYGSRRWSQAAGWLFFSGIVFFSGSLYLMSISDLLQAPELKTFLGPLTPVGGTLLIAGWVAMLRASIHYERKQ